VSFKEEQGVDEGGLTKEWFTLISQQLFNPLYGLFISCGTSSGSNYYPS